MYVKEIGKCIKINQNEFPYPPAPRVRQILEEYAKTGYINRYPSGEYRELKEAIAQYHNVKPEQVTVGNGSDQVLLHIWLAYVGPGDKVVFPEPEYGMPTLHSKLQNAFVEKIDLNPDFTLPTEEFIQRKGKLTFVSIPNAPIGVLYPLEEVEKLVKGLYPDGIIIIDGAYIDFSSGEYRNSIISLIRKHSNLLFVTTSSKVRGMANLRFGYGIGDEDIIKYVEGVRSAAEPYNINGATEVAMLAALEKDSLKYEAEMVNKIKTNRNYLAEELNNLRFKVYPSGANYIFAEHPIPGVARRIYEKLKEKNCLIRYFEGRKRLENGIRITVGTREECEKFIELLKEIL